MKQVRIAELKARLSEYLRAARGGESIAMSNQNSLVKHSIFSWRFFPPFARNRALGPRGGYNTDAQPGMKVK